MSFPKPRPDIKNSRIAIGIANSIATTHMASSSQKSAPEAQTRTATPIIPAPPDTPAMIGVICVMSRTGAPHIVCVAFCAAGEISEYVYTMRHEHVPRASIIVQVCSTHVCMAAFKA